MHLLLGGAFFVSFVFRFFADAQNDGKRKVPPFLFT